MSVFDPGNNYWIVGGDETKAYATPLGDYVAANNAGFLAWKAAGKTPSRIGSEAELGEVLAELSIRPTNLSVLDAYKDTQATNISVKVAAKVLFNHENRIRVLENKAPITANQFKNALKDLM
jgi:hypothetical protein